jgi:selenide, water dikinase
MPDHSDSGTELVLLGIGHTNAHVLRQWLSSPIRDVRLTCVSEFPVATYSGMLPGVLAGQYAPERMEIDLVGLCSLAGVRLIVEPVTKIDAAGSRLMFAHHPPLSYDLLSIGVGSVPDRSDVRIETETCIDIKPMQTFLARLRTALKSAVARKHERPLQIVVVGGGAGGVEISLCLPGFLRRMLDGREFEIRIVHQGAEILPGVSTGMRRRAMARFGKRGVEVTLAETVRAVDGEGIQTASGRRIPADLVIWTGTAIASPLLRESGLPLDDRGFVRTHRTLQSISGLSIFAVGDAGTIDGEPIPKAGVYAVRQGPVLWQNIVKAVHGEPLRTYRPQKTFLKLLNCGDGTAIGDYRGWSCEGRWVWRLKDRIDSRFMSQFRISSAAPAP